MRRIWIAAAAIFAFAPSAFAADSSVPAMGAGSAVGATDTFYCIQGGGTTEANCTAAQLKTFFSNSPTLVTPALGTPASGTLTNTTGFPILNLAGAGTGVLTALGVNVGTAGSVVVNGGALGIPSSGTATNLTGTAAGLTAGNVTTNANLTGMVTSIGNAASLGSFTSANLAAALTDETGTGANVFGTAPTISSPTINTAATLGFITGSTQCLQVNTSGVVSGTGAVCGGSGSTGANPTATASDTAVNGVATTFMRSDAAPAIQKASNSQFGVMEGDGSSISCTAGVCSFNAPINAQTGTSYAIISTDKGKIITATNASASAYSIAAASSLGSAFYTSLINEGAGLVTLTATTSTIDGAGNTVTLKQGQSIDLVNDGTNYFTLRGRPTNVAASDLVGIGTNVAAAVNTTLSAAGGITSTIASGTATGGTSAIASAACGTVITVSAPNTATTDVVTVGFNGDPTAITGFIPATAGMLSIIAYPTSGNINIKECNNTSASITPGAHTYNWRVVR